MEIKVPEVGESVYEALVASWKKSDGDLVRKDEPLCELETDKITLELTAEAAGVLAIAVPAGTTVKVGTVIGSIDEQAAGDPEAAGDRHSEEGPGPPASPSARKLAAERGVELSLLAGSGRGGRVTAEDVLKIKGVGEGGTYPSAHREVFEPLTVRSEEPVLYAAKPPAKGEDRVTRVPMTPIRKRIAERLLAARQQTAMLTTFNEADLGRIQGLRSRYRENFRTRHGVDLGYMSFFVKACVESLKEYPSVNARIDGDDLVYHNYYDIGIAIGGEKGLVVPVLRDADRLHYFEIELRIAGFIEKVKSSRITIADLEGGTFSISNGGVYGSLLSTPILNPPQSAVLGMHAIQERPVAIKGEVVIRPMMYLALSYDHRIIDGRDAVGFLKRVREYIEEPEELFLEG
jgi:2-oxoglutarate dehydrogenase E2 component (dihydrolipoamide succinyltransferase)